MEKKNKLVLDLETSSLDKSIARPLQVSALLVDGFTGEIIDKFDAYVKFPKSFSECCDSERDALDFNFIGDEDLTSDESISRRVCSRDHVNRSKQMYISLSEFNSIAFSEVLFFQKFLKFLRSVPFSVVEGWNHKYFDLPILDNFFLKGFGKKFSELFVFEVKDWYLELLSYSVLSSGLFLKDGLSLKTVYSGRKRDYFLIYSNSEFMQPLVHALKLSVFFPLIFNHSLNFHNSLDDCLAVYYISQYYEDKLGVSEVIRHCCECGVLISPGEEGFAWRDFCLCNSVFCLCSAYSRLYPLKVESKKDLGFLGVDDK